MADLVEGQFEVGGVVLGERTDFIVTSFDPGSAEVRSQDAPRPRRDGVYFGRDTFGPPEWSFEVSTDLTTAEGALAAQGRLAAVWRAPEPRSTPGADIPLRYCIAGLTRRVYGRPRRFAGTPPTAVLYQGRADMLCDFACRDDLFYDDVERSLTLTQVPVSSVGLSEPLVEPLSTQPFGSRPGVVSNDGDAETSLVVRFDGPCTDPSLALTGGDVIALRGSLSASESVVVDTDAASVVLNGGGSFPLYRASRFFKLPPGSQELRYAAIDPTATSRATVAWRPAFTSLGGVPGAGAGFGVFGVSA